MHGLPPQLIARAVLERSTSEELLPLAAREQLAAFEASRKALPNDRASEPPVLHIEHSSPTLDRSASPPLLSTKEAVTRAQTLSKKLSVSNIPNQITESGDLMLDMNGYKTNEEEVLRAEVIARKILAEELEGNYDIGTLIGADEHGNLWIYGSQEAKEAASRKATLSGMTSGTIAGDAASDPGYHSDEERRSPSLGPLAKSDLPQSQRSPAGLITPPHTPPDAANPGDPNRNYAKTLRLTSEQLKKLNLKPGPNPMSFSVNRATCQAYMYYWSHKVPVVISDIDGTITKYVGVLDCLYRILIILA